MKIKYQFATETVEIEVDDDWGNFPRKSVPQHFACSKTATVGVAKSEL